MWKRASSAVRSVTYSQHVISVAAALVGIRTVQRGCRVREGRHEFNGILYSAPEFLNPLAYLRMRQRGRCPSHRGTYLYRSFLSAQHVQPAQLAFKRPNEVSSSTHLEKWLLIIKLVLSIIQAEDVVVGWKVYTDFECSHAFEGCRKKVEYQVLPNYNMTRLMWEQAVIFPVQSLRKHVNPLVM